RFATRRPRGSKTGARVGGRFRSRSFASLRMTSSASSRAVSLLLGDVGRDARLLAREADVEDARLVPESVAVDSQRERGAPEISAGALHRAHDVFLLEFFFREVE